MSRAPAQPATAPLANPARETARLVLMGVVLGAAAAAVYFSPVRQWLGDAQHVRQTMAAAGIWAYPVCILAVAVLVACGMPRLVFALVGAMVLGFWQGLLLSQAGAVLGYYGAFLFVRWGGREWVMHRWPKLQRWSALIHAQGVLGVILARQIPLHGTLINLALGLSHLKHRHFLIGTAIGVLPEAVPVALVGAGLVRGSATATAGYMGLAAAMLVLVLIVWKRTVLRLAHAQDRPLSSDTSGFLDSV